MPLVIRFALPLLLVLGAISWAAAPLVNKMVAQWFLADVEMRSRLLFHSIQDSLATSAGQRSGAAVEALFQRVTQDERVLALGLCSAEGALARRSPAWPAALVCPIGPMTPAGDFTVQRLEGGPVLVAAFPLPGDADKGMRLMIVHDLGFVERRSDHAETYLAVFLACLGLGAAAVTVLVAKLTLRGWVRAMRKGLEERGETGSGLRLTPELAPLMGDIRKMLREFDRARSLSESIRVDWTPDSLRQMLRDELPGAEVLVVSNREPYIHNQDQGALTLQRPASGLVTALEPVMRACGGVWIAHGSGSGDRLTVDGADRLAVPPDAPTYTLRRVWLGDDEQDGYYYGLANEGLWPLCHIAFVRPIFRATDWEYYVAVNRKFAEAVIAEARTDNPVVLVQDYHLALVPRLIRERLPAATIITFWHIPWPNPEVFSICPWKEEILRGLLGSSILGFHTQFHCLNFLDSADRFLECHIDREHSTVGAGDGVTLVRPYPISIEWPPAALAGQPPVEECRRQIFERFGLPSDTRLAVGVERFDYTKGIADRFRAVESLLESHPHWIGRFVLVQVAAPTRSRLDAYRHTRQEAETEAEAVNRRFGRDGWRPIILVPHHHEPEQVFTLFRAAELCLVSSLHDGMNLVAKEFIAARDDGDGVLVLSTFAGASRELLEALIVNPYDIRAMGEALHAGLSMPAEQRRDRMRLMREMVREYNIYHWAGRMLLDAARMRRRRQIERRIASPLVTTSVLPEKEKP